MKVKYEYTEDDGTLFIEAKVIGAPKALLEYMEARIDNYYDANGLVQIWTDGDCIYMEFNLENSPTNLLKSVQDYIDELVRQQTV